MNAATSETNALAYKNTAVTSATNAATSETNANTAASNAASSATSASTSATTATTQANLAIAAYDSFDDRYLGAKATIPTLDNDGNPLLTGAMFFDTTANKMKVYDGVVWQLAGSSVAGITEQQVYTATAGQTTFSIVYDVGFVYVYLNGVRLTSSDFTATNGTSITLNTGCTAGDIVECVSFGTFEIANVYTKDENNTLLNLKANLASPTFTGTPTAPTASTGDNSTKVATTEFVNSEIAGDVGVANSSLVKTALNASGSAPIYACRAWVNFNGTDTVAIRASGNVSSITDNGTGNYAVNFTTTMQDTNYATSFATQSYPGKSPMFVLEHTDAGVRTSSSVGVLILAYDFSLVDGPGEVSIFR
jgi:hypothetical protein